MPPPSESALFPLMVVLLMVRVAEVWMPPPVHEPFPKMVLLLVVRVEEV
jgi:hypothetical protein